MGDNLDSRLVHVTDYSALKLNAHNFRILVQRLAVDVPKLAQELGAEAVAIRGTSGYSVGFAMRMLTDFPIIVARKHGEASHSGTHLALVNDGDFLNIKTYVILDDFVASGNTVDGMMDDIAPAKCKGVLLYGTLQEQLHHWAEKPMELSESDSSQWDTVPVYKYYSASSLTI